MPNKLPRGRTRTADRIATLIRIYRAATRAGDISLRDASAIELRQYGVDVSVLDPIDLANATPPIAPESKGGEQ